MKHLLMIMMTLLFLVPSSASAQSGGLPTTKGLPDGHYWMKLNMADKVTFIDATEFGIKTYWKDAAALAAKDSNSASRFKAPTPKDTVTFPVDKVIEQIDAVYHDTTNIPIPVVFVYRYAVGKLAGESQEKLDQMLDVWRKQQ